MVPEEELAETREKQTGEVAKKDDDGHFCGLTSK